MWRDFLKYSLENWLVLTVVVLALAFCFYCFLKVLGCKRRVRLSETHADRMRESQESIMGLFHYVSQTVRSYFQDSNVNSGELVDALLTHFVETARKSFHCGCAAYFAYDRETKELKMLKSSGLFPSCLDIAEEKLKLIAGKEEKIEEYLKTTSFPLNVTPFASAVDQRRIVNFGRNECESRVRYKIYALWGMLIVPVRSRGEVSGVLVVANKKGKSQFDVEDVELAKGMAEVVSWTLNYLAMIAAIREKAGMDSQLETAASIQSHLLPKSRASMGVVEAEALYKTAYRIGGDYFDFVMVDEDHLGILVADVSGKGIPAGLVMASTRALMSALSKNVLSPAQLLRSLNAHLFQLIPEGMFVTAIYAVIDIRTGEMVCAKAGHEPFLAARKGEDVKVCDSLGMVLGILESEVFDEGIEDVKYELSAGDMVLFYTDGVVEALNRRKEEFNRDRLALALENARNFGPYEALQAIQGRLEKFTDGEPQYDDVTLVAVRIN